MDKNQNNSRPVSNGTSFAELFQDVFGLQAWEEQKQSHHAHRSVPWQWLLWGGLFFFCLGFSFSSESPWIVVVAIAVAVILFLARSTETIEPQVFLLTDDRTDEQKKAYQKKSQMKAASFAKSASHENAPFEDDPSSDTSLEVSAEKFNKETRTRVKRPRRKERFKTKDTVADYPNDEVTASRENAEAEPKPRKPRARHLRRTPRTTPKVQTPVITDEAPLKTESPRLDAIDQAKASESVTPAPMQIQPPKTAVEEAAAAPVAPAVKVDTQPQVTTEPQTQATQEPPKAS